MDRSKKVFISYRRALSTDLAGRIRDNLVARGYDVFLDVANISSGKFGDIILRQIEACPLFIPVLVPGCLERTVDAGDWFRREIEHALAWKRHIVPLASKDFSYESEHGRAKTALPACVRDLSSYHFIVAYAEYFHAAIDKLVTGLDALPDDVDVRATPASERKVVSALIQAARVAAPDALGTGWVFPVSARIIAIPLFAPVMSAISEGLQTRFNWTAVDLSSGYVVERSLTSSFSATTEEVYTGMDTTFTMPASMAARSYRVKARGTGLWADSPWSAVVEVPASTPLISGLNLLNPLKTGVLRPSRGIEAGFAFVPLQAPTLTIAPPRPAPRVPPSGIGTLLESKHQFSWTAVEGADGYELQKSVTPGFTSPRLVYTGTETSFDRAFEFSLVKTYYRVRATRVLGTDGPWSNTVELR